MSKHTGAGECLPTPRLLGGAGHDAKGAPGRREGQAPVEPELEAWEPGFRDLCPVIWRVPPVLAGGGLRGGRRGRRSRGRWMCGLLQTWGLALHVPLPRSPPVTRLGCCAHRQRLPDPPILWYPVTAVMLRAPRLSTPFNHYASNSLN